MSHNNETSDPHSENRSLLRNATFKAPAQGVLTQPGASVLHKLIGTKTAATNRVSESLDYEPVQNRVFSDRQNDKKEGKKKLYG